MDTGLGKLERISEEKADELFEKDVSGIFSVGETLEIKGSKFQIHNINRFGMKLRLLKKEVSMK